MTDNPIVYDKTVVCKNSELTIFRFADNRIIISIGTPSITIGAHYSLDELKMMRDAINEVLAFVNTN